jgi:Ras-related protein Rab-11A
MTDEKTVESYKIVLIGESGVGKTSLISQLMDPSFQHDQQSTTGGTFSTKTVVCDNNRTLKLEIWDTAGQERYRSLTTMFYKDANAAVLVYDITRKDSFEQLKEYWTKQVKENSPSDTILAICGNKSDLVEKEDVNEGTARQFAQSLGAIFVSTSAKSIEQVNNLFIQLVKLYTKCNEVKFIEEEDSTPYKLRKDTVKITKENTVKKSKKKGCC